MTQLLKFIAFRVGSALLTLIGVSIFIFLAIHMLPGSFEDVLAPRGPEELRQQIAEKFGLNQPLPIQYAKWLGSVATGDLGISLITQDPIVDSFASRVPVTIELALLATFTSAVIGIPLGLWSGLAHRRAGVSGIARVLGSFIMSVPDFVIASVFLFVFSRYSLGLTVGQWVPFQEDFGGHIRSIILPAVTLSAVGIGLFITTTRNAVIGILSKDYIMAALARGEEPREIVQGHVLRNISNPLVTTLSIYLGYLIGGAIIVEYVYSVPGMGRFLVQGLLNRDYPIVQATVLVIACAVVFINMTADIAYGLIDPRLRKG
ncbi:ABC-transport protein, inner membrane component [Roseobacter sp. MED193]|uniref:ABC transporter permease n=1 Tax=Roseobacter sp. MED193 TaxID=314262 RepID=UPI000068A04D|nr:ABC transporter permease [Roseobacter sp. MED193]EAQ43973.1 ABC-transport protein, inner membrane component [Roseobacter sp. MED193]